MTLCQQSISLLFLDRVEEMGMEVQVPCLASMDTVGRIGALLQWAGVDVKDLHLSSSDT